jgi:cytochrome c2
MMRTPALVLAALAGATPALGADANAGKSYFHQQCALCHSAQPDDNGGAQGPNLNGVFERRSASDPRFGYTKALQAANLTWDAATLDRFLAAPTTVVPGSAMVVAIPKESPPAGNPPSRRNMSATASRSCTARGIAPFVPATRWYGSA